MIQVNRIYLIFNRLVTKKFLVDTSDFMNMYIGNLSYNVRESDLRQVMEEYGTVESVKLIMDRNTNRSKGFAFVEMPEAAEAQQAINKLNGAEYVGRQMVVKEALPRN